MGYIYVIKNDINDKLYIGKTSTTILNRWYHHKDAYLTNDWHLYRAMRKYGIEHFWIEEIEKCPDKILNEREVFWIKKLDTYSNGYNMTTGGDGRLSLNRELILKEWNSGKSVTEIANLLNCWSSSVIDILKELDVYDKEEIQRRKVLYIANKQCKEKIVQYDGNGQQINVFSSPYEASLSTGISKKAIRTAIDTKIGAGGFLWQYENEKPPAPRYVKTCKKHIIEQIDLTTNTVIATFQGASCAGKELGIDPSAITKVCKNKRNKAGGYGWRYKNEKE